MLRAERYDYVIDLHNNQRTWLMKLLLGVQSFSFSKINFEKWLMVNFKINRLPSLHIVDRYFDTVKNIEVVNDGKGLDFFIHTANHTFSIAEPYIAWAIGAKQKTKQFPVSKIVEVLNDARFPNIKVVLLGGKEDIERTQQIISVTKPESVTSLVGICNLQESASVIQHAALVITNDTGLMHIAAALQKPIVSIWGNTIPAFGMSPYYGTSAVGSGILQVENLHCRPCSKLGFNACPQKHFNCMEHIATEDTLQQIRQLL
jgi:ADP-heptose:LPS heptosyltransferase